MIPIVTPAQMAAIDAAADVPVDVLVARAGAAVAREAIARLGGTYGRRAVVLAGPGNNGADGRVAADRLRRRGVRVVVFEAAGPRGERPDALPAADLYIDAAFGTGLSRPYEPPRRARLDAPVLAVDIPSGVDGLTGLVAGGEPWRADITVTFAALKPGLLLGAGPDLSGSVRVVDIGLADGVDPPCWLVTAADIDDLPAGSSATHKWHSAVLVVAGSQGMAGAAALTCSAAARSGGRMVHLNAPVPVAGGAPREVVWSEPPLAVDPARFHCLALGPGIGRDADAHRRMTDALALPIPAVVDADALTLLGAADPAQLIRSRSAPTVVTPHDGEFALLTGSSPGPDRIAAARGAADQLQCTVVLKGGPSVIADPAGRVFVVDSGDSRLATAGTGDVLTGMIAGRMAAFRADDPPWRAAEAAFIHGRLATTIGASNPVAADLIDGLTVGWA